MKDKADTLPGAGSDYTLLLTAAEAFPALEDAWLDATSEIWASFRIFDLSTRLHSPRARKLGDTWFDLVVDTLRRGVSVHMTLTDFDPIIRADTHRLTWRSLRLVCAAREAAGDAADLTVKVAMHSARVGLLPRLPLWPKIVGEVQDTANRLNALPRKDRIRALQEMPGTQRWLVCRADGTLRARRWPVPSLCPTTHHQKIAVFDRQVLFVGGIDLNDRRYDTPRHDRNSEQTWQDVQIIVTGPAVDEAQHHIETFLDTVMGKKAPVQGQHLRTTLSSKRGFSLPFMSPRAVSTQLADTHLDLAKKAKHLIYLETQFFRDRKFAKALAQAARDNPALRLILIVPAAPEEVAFEGATGLDSRYGEFMQAKCIRIIERAFGDRLAICAPVQPQRKADAGKRDALADAPIIYVHAKVSIFDDSAAIVSSANLNGRSFYWDTEAGVLIDNANDVQKLRRRIFAHWLPDNAEMRYFDLENAATEWRELAKDNLGRAPANRRGFLVPYDAAPAERFGTSLPGVPEEMV